MARSTPHTYAVDPFSTEYKMASGKVALTFESVDEIVMCNHSNDTSLLVLSHGTIILFFNISQNKIWKFCQLLTLLTFGSERVNSCDRPA